MPLPIYYTVKLTITFLTQLLNIVNLAVIFKILSRATIISEVFNSLQMHYLYFFSIELYFIDNRTERVVINRVINAGSTVA